MTRDVASMPTAVMGEAGEGGPVIAILGEYDALPGLSQEAGVAGTEPPCPGNAFGHGCGHNMLGSGLHAGGGRSEGLPGSEWHQRAACATTAARRRKAARRKGFMARAGAFQRCRRGDLLAPVRRSSGV